MNDRLAGPMGASWYSAGVQVLARSANYPHEDRLYLARVSQYVAAIRYTSLPLGQRTVIAKIMELSTGSTVRIAS
jgi:SLT domain-containing protein